MSTTQVITDIVSSSRLLRGLMDRDDDGDLYPTVDVAISYTGRYGDLAVPVQQKIERSIAHELSLTGWTRERGETTETGEVWTYRRPAHRPRRDPAAARVGRSYRLHPDTIALIDAEAKRTGKSAGQVIDDLAHTLSAEYLQAATCDIIGICKKCGRSQRWLDTHTVNGRSEECRECGHHQGETTDGEAVGSTPTIHTSA